MKNPKVKYEYDDPGVVELGQSGAMRGMLQKRANAGLQAARAMAPSNSGDYPSSFFTSEVTVRAGYYHKPRAAVLLGNTAGNAHAIEARKRVLSNAMASAEIW